MLQRLKLRYDCGVTKYYAGRRSEQLGLSEMSIIIRVFFQYTNLKLLEPPDEVNNRPNAKKPNHSRLQGLKPLRCTRQISCPRNFGINLETATSGISSQRY